MILLLPLQALDSKPPTHPLQKVDAAHGKYVVSAGKGFMPFLKQCSTYFPLNLQWSHFESAVVFFSGWDIYEGGHEALTCTG